MYRPADSPDVNSIGPSAGSGGVRKALSMPALVAAPFNPGMKAKYAELAAAG